MLIGCQDDSEWMYTDRRSMSEIMLIAGKSCAHLTRSCMSTYRKHIMKISRQHVSVIYELGYVGKDKISIFLGDFPGCYIDSIY